MVQGSSGMVAHEDETSQPAVRQPARGIKRIAFLVAGCLCVGLAYLGALLPGLPTTPWVLLASYCFSRSSPRLERWLKRSPFFGRLIRDWELHGGMRLPVKLFAVLMIITAVTLSIVFGGLPAWLPWLIGGLALCGVGTIILLVPTVHADSHRK